MVISSFNMTVIILSLYLSLHAIVGAGLSGEDVRRVAVVEGDPVTLVCGTDLTGNPLPLIVWRDNNAMSVFGMEGERNGLLLILTVIALLMTIVDH